MPVVPETRYAMSGSVDLAFQVLGDGEHDVVIVPSWIGNIEAFWDLAELADLLDGFAAFSRLIIFDKRGTGLSDRTTQLATLEERADDVRVVMDAAGSTRASVVAWADAAPIASVFAAMHPERVSSLVLGSFVPAGPAAVNDDGLALDAEQADQIARAVADGWGTASLAPLIAPSLASDERFLSWFRKWERVLGTPTSALAELRWENALDVCAVLPTIRCPTLVVHRRDIALFDRGAVEAAARLIPGAIYEELPGADLVPFAGDRSAILAEVEEFITGSHTLLDTDRVLATVLFTDIVDSTRIAGALGDRGWRNLLDAHHREIRRCLERFGGTEVDTAGDGFFATFDGPARAVRCACAARDAVRVIGLEIRAGLHTGEVERRGTDVTGLAVHVGARVGALAGTSEVVVTSTVKELVLGSGIQFEERGVHTLKGVPDEWRLFRVVDC